MSSMSFVLIGPKLSDEDTPYDIMRTKTQVGSLLTLPQGQIAEADLMRIGQAFAELKKAKTMSKRYWTKHIFTDQGQPLFYTKLFSMEPWGRDA